MSMSIVLWGEDNLARGVNDGIMHDKTSEPQQSPLFSTNIFSYIYILHSVSRT